MISGSTKEAFLKIASTEEELMERYDEEFMTQPYKAEPPKTVPYTKPTITNGGNKNTFGPYLTPYTPKAMQPAEDLMKGAYGDLYRNDFESVGAMEFGKDYYKDGTNFINQRAGDPNYIQAQHKMVMDYVNNPDNGWDKQTDGTYRNTRTGQVYDPRLGEKLSYDKVGYSFSPDDSGMAWGNYLALPSRTSDSYSNIFRKNNPDLRDILKYTNRNDVIHPDMSSHPAPVYSVMKAGDVNKYVPVLTAGHEFNHLFTKHLIDRGLINPYRKNQPIGKSYATKPVELGNAASLFQQQHFRNTGRRIVDKNKFWDDINNAKKNIKDYDPESRRFLQSLDILQNEAPNDPESAYILNQIHEAMPLITNNKQLPGYNRNYRHNRIG